MCDVHLSALNDNAISEETKQLNSEAVRLIQERRFNEAIPIASQIQNLLEKALGAEHPDLIGNLNSLSALYRNCGKYYEAESFCQRALAIVEKSLGPDHPDAAIILASLALLYRHRGKHAEAELFYKRALAVVEKALGPDHPETADGLTNLAMLYISEDRYSEAVDKRNKGHFQKRVFTTSDKYDLCKPAPSHVPPM
jgi:tetratricopeptide (TPR) repeat protein